MSIETLRPTANTTPFTGGFVAWSNPANAYDGNTATAATGNASSSGSGPGGGSQSADMVVKTWQTPVHQAAYTALVLKAQIDSSGTTSNSGSGSTAGEAWTLQYSTDGGTTWTSWQTGSGTLANTVYSVSLSTAQDFTKIQVKVTASATGSAPSGGSWNATASMDAFEVWTEGTYTPGSTQAVLTGV